MFNYTFGLLNTFQVLICRSTYMVGIFRCYSICKGNEEENNFLLGIFWVQFNTSL